MKNRKTQLSLLLIAPFVLLYFLSIFGSSALYLCFSLYELFFDPQFPIKKIILWISVGLSLSLLAALACWPFALSVATLLEHNRSRKMAIYTLQGLSYFSTLPLILFAYIYIEVFSHQGFHYLQAYWHYVFASTNLLTQALAFALTLLLYPLTIFPIFGETLSIDLFFQKMLRAVIDFSEVSFVASVVVIGLFLYILPKMILHMRRQLNEDEDLRSFEIIQSLGGTSWESIHLTVMQSMKIRFNSIIVYFTRICFFEGLISYTLLQAFILQGGDIHSYWGSGLTSIFLFESIQGDHGLSFLMGLSGLLVVCYGLFMRIERVFRQRSEAQYG